jgi:hypothetical protein
MAVKEVRGNVDAAVSLLYNRHQQAFLRALRTQTAGGRHGFHRLALFAGRRGGKTKIGAVGVSDRMSTLPSSRSAPSLGWVCAPTYPDLHDFVIPEVLRMIPQQWIGDWSEQHYTLELKNYAQCMFRSLDDPDKARGPGLDWAWIDETRKVQELAWMTMLPALTDKRGQAWFTTSPNGRDWSYKTFWLPALQGVPGYWAVKYKTSDNPAIDPDEIADAKRAMDPLFFRQEFEADFVTFTGAIYGALLNNQILRTDDDIRALIPEWPLIDPSRVAYEGIDPGGDHPFAAVLCVMTAKGLVAIGEYASKFKPINEHVNSIRQMRGKFDPARPFQPTTSACDKSQRQFMIEMAQPHYGIYTVPAPNQVEDGIRRVQAWLAQRQLWFLLPEAEPSRGVPMLVEQMENYRWAENTAPDGQSRKEKVIKRDDDLPDALRYLLMAGPMLEERDLSPSNGLRDISAMPDLVRHEIETLRRMEHRDKPREDSPFFASDDLPGLVAGDDDHDSTPASGDFWL